MASLQTIRRLWFALTKRKQWFRAKTLPEVILHDPGAQRPHDLDDAFYDPKLQLRIGREIAKHAAKKKN